MIALDNLNEPPWVSGKLDIRENGLPATPYRGDLQYSVDAPHLRLFIARTT